MTDNTMREGKLWAFLHDSIHEAYKKLSTTGTSTEYHTMLDSIASKVADDVDARFLQAAQSVPVLGEPDCYDAGLLGDFGGGNVEWWQDYIRAELARAHDFYASQWPSASVPVVSNVVGYLAGGTLMRRKIQGYACKPLVVQPTHAILAAELATLREKAAEADELRKDAERYRKLRGWMSSNVKEGWGRVTDLSAVFCYVSWQEGDSYLDNLPECNVGLMQKDAAIAQGKGE